MDAPRIFTPEYYRHIRVLENVSWWNQGMRDIAAQLLDMAALPPAGVMVDVGCGSGQTMAWFADRHPGWRTLGLDVAADALAVASTVGARHILRACALQLPILPRSVDLVIALDVLQHLPLDGGDRQSLVEIARVLKPGGHLLVRTNAQTFPRVADDPVFQFHKYDSGELRARLEQAGLGVVRLGRVNALLGLAEIPREIAGKRQLHSYRGLPSAPRRDWRWGAVIKRAWLRVEGRAVRYGLSWPLGRATVALCQRRDGS